MLGKHLIFSLHYYKPQHPQMLKIECTSSVEMSLSKMEYAQDRTDHGLYQSETLKKVLWLHMR